MEFKKKKKKKITNTYDWSIWCIEKGQVLHDDNG
jgi:hypothetical protein